MKHVARNLCRHPNGTYYSEFDGVPRSLKTKSKAEAKRLLKAVRLEKVKAAHLNFQAPAVASQPAQPSAPANGELAELKAMLSSLVSEVAQLRAAAHTAQPANESPPAPPDSTPFERFQDQNLKTLCSTVKKDSKKMYRKAASRLMKVLRSHQRHLRRNASRAAVASAPDPELWPIFRDLGPGGVWGDWQDRKGLDPSSLNHLRVYLGQLVEDAVDQGFLDPRFIRLVKKIPILPVEPDLPVVPALHEMDALLRACRSVDAKCGRIIEFIACTGVRPGAFCDIEWSDVDFTGKLMTVAQDGLRPPVDISEQAMTLLLELKGDRPDPMGRVIEASDYLLKKARKVMKRCVKALIEEYPDLRDMTDLKSLRHYFASVCIMNGVDFKTISLWLGHNDGGVLVAKVYGHLRRDHTKQAMSSIRFSEPPAKALTDNGSVVPVPVGQRAIQPVETAAGSD